MKLTQLFKKYSHSNSLFQILISKQKHQTSIQFSNLLLWLLKPGAKIPNTNPSISELLCRNPAIKKEYQKFKTENTAIRAVSNFKEKFLLNFSPNFLDDPRETKQEILLVTLTFNTTQQTQLVQSWSKSCDYKKCTWKSHTLEKITEASASSQLRKWYTKNLSNYKYDANKSAYDFLDDFLWNIKRVYNPVNWKYCYVGEWQERGMLHYHLVMTNPFPKYLLNAHKTNCGLKKNLTGCVTCQFNLNHLWKFGYTNIQRIRDERDGMNYLIKYIYKTIRDPRYQEFRETELGKHKQNFFGFFRKTHNSFPETNPEVKRPSRSISGRFMITEEGLEIEVADQLQQLWDNFINSLLLDLQEHPLSKRTIKRLDSLLKNLPKPHLTGHSGCKPFKQACIKNIPNPNITQILAELSYLNPLPDIIIKEYPRKPEHYEIKEGQWEKILVEKVFLIFKYSSKEILDTHIHDHVIPAIERLGKKTNEDIIKIAQSYIKNDDETRTNFEIYQPQMSLVRVKNFEEYTFNYDNYRELLVVKDYNDYIMNFDLERIYENSLPDPTSLSTHLTPIQKRKREGIQKQNQLLLKKLHYREIYLRNIKRKLDGKKPLYPELLPIYPEQTIKYFYWKPLNVHFNLSTHNPPKWDSFKQRFYWKILTDYPAIPVQNYTMFYEVSWTDEEFMKGHDRFHILRNLIPEFRGSEEEYFKSIKWPLFISPEIQQIDKDLNLLYSTLEQNPDNTENKESVVLKQHDKEQFIKTLSQKSHLPDCYNCQNDPELKPLLTHLASGNLLHLEDEMLEDEIKTTRLKVSQTHPYYPDYLNIDPIIFQGKTSVEQLKLFFTLPEKVRQAHIDRDNFEFTPETSAIYLSLKGSSQGLDLYEEPELLQETIQPAIENQLKLYSEIEDIQYLNYKRYLKHSHALQIKYNQFREHKSTSETILNYPERFPEYFVTNPPITEPLNPRPNIYEKNPGLFEHLNAKHTLKEFHSYSDWNMTFEDWFTRLRGEVRNKIQPHFDYYYSEIPRKLFNGANCYTSHWSYSHRDSKRFPGITVNEWWRLTNQADEPINFTQLQFRGITQMLKKPHSFIDHMKYCSSHAWGYDFLFSTYEHFHSFYSQQFTPSWWKDFNYQNFNLAIWTSIIQYSKRPCTLHPKTFRDRNKGV